MSKLTVFPSITISTSWQRLTTTSYGTMGQEFVVSISAAVYMNNVASGTGQTYLAGPQVYRFSAVDPASIYFSQVSAGAAVGGYMITE